MTKFKAIEVAYHRNGVGGEGFYIVRFTCSEAKGEFVAIRFRKDDGDFNPCCAILNVPMLAEGNIAMAMGNSWRGDHFVADVDAAIEDYRAGADARLAAIYNERAD